jgi:LmbE family N-acetylglucosaminyl deacetylase
MTEQEPTEHEPTESEPTESEPTEHEPTEHEPRMPALPLGDASEVAMRSKDVPTPTNALAIVAHPDDAEFQCGGTLAKWAADGCTIHHLVLTDGSKGSWDVDVDIAHLIEARRNEQLDAARMLGSAGKVIMLGEVDGELSPNPELIDQVAYWIRATRADVVLAHDPWKTYRLHPDHRNAGWIALDGVVAARDPHFFPHHDVAHHRPSALLLFEAERPDHIEDIGGHVHTKADALLAHRSQFVTTHGITEPDDEHQREQFRNQVIDHAADIGAANGIGHGEIFKLISDL